MPAFPVSVPDDLYRSVAGQAGEPFADSYLFGANIDGRKLWLRTVTGWNAVRDNYAVSKAIQDLGYEIPKPRPFVADGMKPMGSDFGAPRPKGKKRSRPEANWGWGDD